MIFDFKFKPLDFIEVISFSCRGRIIECSFGAARIPKYYVEYAINGDIKNHRFYEDELK